MSTQTTLTPPQRPSRSRGKTETPTGEAPAPVAVPAPELATLPPPLPRIDAAAFRRQIAGLADPAPAAHPGTGGGDADTFRGRSVGLAVMAATHFNRDSLEVTTLWSRVASAIQRACAAVTDGDLERFVSVVFDHVKARPAMLAADAEVAVFVEAAADRDPSWRRAFVQYMATRTPAIVIFARARWEREKAERTARREQLRREAGAESEVARG